MLQSLVLGVCLFVESPQARRPIIPLRAPYTEYDSENIADLLFVPGPRQQILCILRTIWIRLYRTRLQIIRLCRIRPFPIHLTSTLPSRLPVVRRQPSELYPHTHNFSGTDCFKQIFVSN